MFNIRESRNDYFGFFLYIIILDSKRSEKIIDFTVACGFLIFVSVPMISSRMFVRIINFISGFYNVKLDIISAIGRLISDIFFYFSSTLGETDEKLQKHG